MKTLVFNLTNKVLPLENISFGPEYQLFGPMGLQPDSISALRWLRAQFDLIDQRSFISTNVHIELPEQLLPIHFALANMIAIAFNELNVPVEMMAQTGKPGAYINLSSYGAEGRAWAIEWQEKQRNYAILQFGKELHEN